MRIRPRITLKVALLLILLAAMACAYLKPRLKPTHIPLALLVTEFNKAVAARSRNLVKPLTMREVTTALKAGGSEEVLTATRSGRVPLDTRLYLHWEGEFPLPWS